MADGGVTPIKLPDGYTDQLPVDEAADLILKSGVKLPLRELSRNRVQQPEVTGVRELEHVLRASGIPAERANKLGERIAALFEVELIRNHLASRPKIERPSYGLA